MSTSKKTETKDTQPRTRETDAARVEAALSNTEAVQPSPEDERKRLRDLAAKTAEGVDESKLIEVDANRVAFHFVAEPVGDEQIIVGRKLTRDQAEDLPRDLIKVDPAKVRFESLDPSNGPQAPEATAQVVDSLGIPVPAVSPPEAFRQKK